MGCILFKSLHATSENKNWNIVENFPLWKSTLFFLFINHC